MPPLVMLIRHGEKAVPDGPQGVNIDGASDQESLTPRGWQRAGALVNLFVPRPPHTTAQLPTPTHLFASQVGPNSSSKRPLETIQPLSERLNIVIDTSHLKEELGQLAQTVRAIDGVVLVSWEHHLIPSIAVLLAGNATNVPQIWPDDRFDLVWLVDLRGPTGPPSFSQIPELLLGGDSKLVIPG
jgi:broad specificity phosphatase PhoE